MSLTLRVRAAAVTEQAVAEVRILSGFVLIVEAADIVYNRNLWKSPFENCILSNCGKSNWGRIGRAVP